MAEGMNETIDLTIEALTGTVYDLCVSPFETILGIKMKIQRLEGIPVYQQQLVYGGTELQDEFCLEEYSIPSGAQLKLMIAMRGGPIHAQRVQLDLDDPTLLEIAELLDAQPGEKYTVMLVKNGEDIDNTNFLHLQMYNEEESCDSVSCSPVQVSESQHGIGVVTSKTTQTEHAVTRDKMKELMSKLRKVRSFRQVPAPPLTARSSATQLQRKGTTAAKVLVLNSRASSRLLKSSSRETPLPQLHHNEPRVSTAQRRLMFSCDDSNQHSGSSGGSLTAKRTRSPDDGTPLLNKKYFSQSTDVEMGVVNDQPHPPPHWELRKAPKRARRHSRRNEPAHVTSTVNDLNGQISRLALDKRDTDIVGSEPRGSFLPSIPSAYSPVSLTTTHANKTKGPAPHSLPPLSIASSPLTASKQGSTSKRRNRCMQCGKKMGLATAYSCRCGGMFCALHRYAETHSCTFDYKTEGRQIIARNNPVVTAPKLPKI